MEALWEQVLSILVAGSQRIPSQAPKWTILPTSLGKWAFNHPDARVLLVLSVPGTERRQVALHRVLVTWSSRPALPTAGSSNKLVFRRIDL